MSVGSDSDTRYCARRRSTLPLTGPSMRARKPADAVEEHREDVAQVWRIGGYAVPLTAEELGLPKRA